MPKTDDPYQFRGFHSPRYTQTPNELFDELLAPGRLSEAELRVLLYIVRHTFGYSKDIDAISLSQFLDGVQKKDGTFQDQGCGLGRAAVVRGIKGLEAKGIITVTRRRSNRHGDEINTYSLRWADTASVSPAYLSNTGGVSAEDGGSIRAIAEGDSERDSQNTKQNTNDKREEDKDRLNEQAPSPMYSPVIAGAILDLARTTREELAGPRLVTDALHLWQRSGWSEARFVAALQEAHKQHKQLTTLLTALGQQIAARPPESGAEDG